jgi:hypothetical protein
LAILVYVVLDGYDLGVGILFGTTRSEQHRVTMMSAIAPFWDANETWLILIGAGLFATFPMVYAIFLPAFYLPVALMLLGLIFRGVAFEFRQRSQRMRPVRDWGFFLASLTRPSCRARRSAGWCRSCLWSTDAMRAAPSSGSRRSRSCAAPPLSSATRCWGPPGWC